MSRSKPSENAPNPAVRWFEWNGESGSVRYYDKDAKQNVSLGADFTFLLLDQLGGVGGWHEASKSSIFSNAVRDTRQDVLVVKAFKGGTLAEGLYKDIKDRVAAVGGYFVSTCYIAFKQAGNGLDIGAIKFKGSALSAWMEFTKAHRPHLYDKAIQIDGYTEGKKGRITFRVPTFIVKDVLDDTNNAAVALDERLQDYLTGYLARTKSEQVEQPAAPMDAPPQDDEPDFSSSEPNRFEAEDDDIPF